MIYFIRHGATDWNEHINEKGEKCPKCQGRIDNELNDNGIAQAYECAKSLEGVEFVKVICSPLARALQTAKIVCGDKYNIEIDKRLIERDFGEFEGKTREEFDFKRFWTEDDSYKYNAESIESVKKRVYELLDELKRVNGNVLLVGHGGAGLILSSYFYGEPKDKCYTSFELAHAKANVFEYK